MVALIEQVSMHLPKFYFFFFKLKVAHLQVLNKDKLYVFGELLAMENVQVMLYCNLNLPFLFELELKRL